MGDITIYGQPITQVKNFKYLGFHLHTGITLARWLKPYASDRLAQVTLAFYHVKSHYSMLGIANWGLLCLMVGGYVVSHLLFGVSVWGHVLGQTIHPQPTNSHTVVGAIEVHHRQTLWWALGALVDLRNVFFLYLLSGTVSIQYLVFKQ